MGRRTVVIPHDLTVTAVMLVARKNRQGFVFRFAGLPKTFPLNNHLNRCLPSRPSHFLSSTRT